MWGGGQNRLPHSLNGSFLWSSFETQGRKCVTNYLKKNRIIPANNQNYQHDRDTQSLYWLLLTELSAWPCDIASCDKRHVGWGSEQVASFSQWIFLWSSFGFTRTEVCNQLLKKTQFYFDRVLMLACHQNYTSQQPKLPARQGHTEPLLVAPHGAICMTSWMRYKCSIWFLHHIHTACKQTAMLA
jgi:hypothetical protein